MNILKFLFVSFSILFLCTSQVNSAIHPPHHVGAPGAAAFNPKREALAILYTPGVRIGHTLRDHAEDTHPQDKSYFYLSSQDPNSPRELIRLLISGAHNIVKHQITMTPHGRRKLTMDVHTLHEISGRDGFGKTSQGGMITGFIRIVFLLPEPAPYNYPGEIVTAFPIDRDQAENPNFI